MKTCESCHNEYDKCFDVSIGGTNHTFDSFACAIHALAPRCEKCKVPIIGHGTEARGAYYCCASCARSAGISDVADHGDDAPSAP